MPRSTKEWIGKTDDAKIPPRVRLRVFDRFNGICQLSGRKINAGDKWEVHHKKALIQGGENRENNLVPVLHKPHKEETKRQMAEKKKTQSIRKKHLGITSPKQKIQSRGFYKSSKKPRIDKQPLPPKQLFRSA